MWFVVPCAGVLHPEKPDFPYPEAILEMPEEEALKTKAAEQQAKPEVIAVENFF